MKAVSLDSTKRINKSRRGSSLIFVLFFVVIFLALAALAVDGSIIFTNRLALQNATEMSALAGAAEFTNDTAADLTTQVKKTATQTFELLKKNKLETANIVNSNYLNNNNIDANDVDDDVEVDSSGKTVTVYTKMIAEPFFLSFLGVSGINLQAKATAVSETLPVLSSYSNINWVTISAAYKSDVISISNDFHNSAILIPQSESYSASISPSTSFPLYNLIDSVDSKPLNLGPGGYITIKLPAPIIDKPGPDLFIKEVGALEGYMVFAGLDNDPSSPYVNNTEPGADISWINISSSGTSSELGAKAHQSASTKLATPVQDKFYGSGNFDISKCGISMVKYIRIVDDNHESSFQKGTDGIYYKTMMYGEASTSTAGADIDGVNLLNRVRLQ